jgi:hypothetical protein
MLVTSSGQQPGGTLVSLNPLTDSICTQFEGLYRESYKVTCPLFRQTTVNKESKKEESDEITKILRVI